MGSASLTTDGTGNGKFILSASGDFVGQYFSATATSAGGDTSEFDADALAVNGAGPPEFGGPFSLTASGFNTKIELTAGQNYTIEATTNLSIGTDWVTLTNFTATNATFMFTDRSATNLRVRFYRILSP